MLSKDQTGSCQIRTNQQNSLVPITYAQFCSIAIDPIEKKPLYHYFPGEKILSLGSIGCNFHCHHCQNWQISQPHKNDSPPMLRHISISEIISTATEHGVKLIAFTYNEPLIQIETLLHYLPILQKEGFKTILVTNLFINPEPLKDLLPYVDALSVDLKAFASDSYKELTTVNALEIVKQNILTCYNNAKHIELVTNLVTDINDNMEQIKNAAKWINSVSEDIPWHISFFYPTFEYKHKQPVSKDLLDSIERIRSKLHLNHVFTRHSQDTLCPSCKRAIIKRSAFNVNDQISTKTCPYCEKEVPYLHA